MVGLVPLLLRALVWVLRALVWVLRVLVQALRALVWVLKALVWVLRALLWALRALGVSRAKPLRGRPLPSQRFAGASAGAAAYVLAKLSWHTN